MKTLFGLTLLFLIFTSQVARSEPLLKGSPESQIKQNAAADRSELIRIKDDTELETMKATGQLVHIPDTPGVRVDARLHERFRFVRPWVATFLVDLGKDFKERFGEEIQINSAVRTIEYQIEISGRNRNAAETTGEKRSSHLTGSAIDIAKLRLTGEQKLWLRTRLVTLELGNTIEATEEHYQAVFHVMVFPEYEVPQVRTAKQ